MARPLTHKCPWCDGSVQVPGDFCQTCKEKLEVVVVRRPVGAFHVKQRSKLLEAE